MLQVKPLNYSFDVPISGFRSITFTFSLEGGEPINLYGATVKTEAWNSDRSIKFFDVPTTVISQNQVKLYITPDISDNPPPETANYDILVIWPDQTKDWLVRGTISFSMTYTRN